jgi:YgiT-type zinc finger domain-containing protein
MKELKLLGTIKNLLTGFIINSETRSRYELYADIAKNEGLFLISKTFLDFAEERKYIAYWFYKMIQELGKKENLNSLRLDIKSPYPLRSTLENLEYAIKGENEEWQNLYPQFSNAAELDGYRRLVKKFKELIQTGKTHSQRLNLFLNLIKNNTLSKEKSFQFWKCLACGYEVALEELTNSLICPSCGHDKSYFQKKVLQILPDKKSLEKKQITGWVCMECGSEVAMEELPDNWKCVSCGKPKAYFKKKILKSFNYQIYSGQREKAQWICLECGNKEEIDMPVDWKCPKCEFPHKK